MVKATLEDVGGRFALFVRQGPAVYRKAVLPTVQATAFEVRARMRRGAPVGPDAPHIRDDVEVDVSELTALVGYITKPEQAAVALYNEYRPNKQPFMRAALEDEADEFRRAVTKALHHAERALSR